MNLTKAWSIVAEEAERGLETRNEEDRKELQEALEMIEDIVLLHY